MKPLLAASIALSLLILASSCATANRPVADPYEYLTITGQIDGSEKFIFTPERVQWAHLHWSEPDDMTFQGIPWYNPRKTPAQWARYATLDLPHARIVKRQGRDLVSLEPTENGFILCFDDAPNGAAAYSVTIAIPKKAGKK